MPVLTSTRMTFVNNKMDIIQYPGVLYCLKWRDYGINPLYFDDNFTYLLLEFPDLR